MKKILITGINGFVGSNCEKFFGGKGFDVYGIDLIGEERKNVVIGEVSFDNIKSFGVDFDVIIHLAGSGTVSSSQMAPDVERVKSVGSCVEVLDYMKKCNKKTRLIYSSSAAVYGNDYNYPIKESDRLNPISVYGNHKLEAEKIFEKCAKLDNLDIKIVRIFSLYGEGLSKQLLFDFSKRAMAENGQKMLCFGTGDEKRDFVHINDVLNFFDILLKEDFGFEIYNVASGRAVSVKEIMTLLMRELGKDFELEFDNKIREGNPNCLIGNIEKAKNIGFEPKIKIGEGVKRYVRWFREKV